MTPPLPHIDHLDSATFIMHARSTNFRPADASLFLGQWCVSVVVDSGAPASSTQDFLVGTSNAVLGVRVFDLRKYRIGSRDYSSPDYFKITGADLAPKQARFAVTCQNRRQMKAQHMHVKPLPRLSLPG